MSNNPMFCAYNETTRNEPNFTQKRFMQRTLFQLFKINIIFTYIHQPTDTKKAMPTQKKKLIASNDLGAAKTKAMQPHA